MARRKGKSQQRIKDWRQRLDGESDSSESSRQKLAPRAVKLPEWRRDRPDPATLEGLPRREGMVVGLFPGGAMVRADHELLLCGLAGTFRPPEGASALAVGDVVSLALTRPEHADGNTGDDKDRADGMILARAPRRTALTRPQPRSGKRRDEYDERPFEKVLAANMDLLLIVASTRQPPLRHGLIDRFLIIAERGELQPILVVNKIDLAEPDEDVLADFQALGVRIVLCSAADGRGLDELRAVLAGKQSVLAGASGVGKSTLINAIVPGAEAATAAVRQKDQRGRHTTTAAVVYDLPGGGTVIDTPGLRELGIGIGPAELTWYFPEFEPLAARCRFRDCTHSREPDCAVQQAAENGEILPRRYESYLRILETLDER